MVHATDIDILVIAVVVFEDLLIEEVSIAFGRRLTFQFIHFICLHSFHEICSPNGPSKAKSLPCLHALTGCDAVSSFSRRAKLRAWKPGLT